MSVAMHPGPVFVDAILLGNKFPVELEIGKNEQPRAVGARQR
jgi:hypothetical protein